MCRLLPVKWRCGSESGRNTDFFAPYTAPVPHEIDLHMRITGRIVYQDLEGGFWGIVADDGSQYHPVEGLPHHLRKDGCRVRAEVEPTNVVSFAMWGKNVRVKNIQRI